MKFQDLTGHVFGRLTVIRRDGDVKPTRWICVCECGKEYASTAGHLKSGNIKSCGCLRASSGGHSNGGTDKNPSREYHSWRSMKDRCYRPDNKKYKYYGGKGVTVCDEWNESFAKFHEDMGDRPPGMSIDRIDSLGNYNKANCKWSTRAEQARNTSSNRMIEFRGRTQCLMDWAGGDRSVYATLFYRLKRIWSVEKTLTTPIPNSKWQHQPQSESKADAVD